MIAVFYSETGFMSIRYGRVVLALRYLLRLLSECHATSHLAPLGIDTCRTMWLNVSNC